MKPIAPIVEAAVPATWPTSSSAREVSSGVRAVLSDTSRVVATKKKGNAGVPPAAAVVARLAVATVTRRASTPIAVRLVPKRATSLVDPSVNPAITTDVAANHRKNWEPRP